MALEQVYAGIAERFQEAAAKLSAKELRDSISKGVDAAHKDGPRSANYVDHTGDDKAGSVVYQMGWSGDDYRQAPYTKATGGHTVDAENATKVKPNMSWAPCGEAAKPADQAKAEAAAKKAADEKKATEAAASGTGDVLLQESAAFAPDYDLREAAGAAMNPLVKIISPGRGSSGFYTKEMLQRDGPKVFKRGTLMYINHATKAEETARPEGDYSKLAAVTTGDAYWDEAGRDGPALYAPSKVFAGFAAEVAEKAPYTGVSIRARGKKDDKKIAPDGKPGVIESLHHAESIDMVTKAGRDGKLLLESATGSESTEGEVMDANALQKLQEANRKIFKGFASTAARALAETTLRPIRLSAASKASIIERACADVPVSEAGDFDEANFKKALDAEITYAASFIEGGVKAIGVGTAAVADPKVLEAQETRRTEARKHWLNRAAGNMHIRTEEGRRIFREGRRAFDNNFNVAEAAKGA